MRHQLGEIASELLAVRFTGYRTLTALQKGQIPGPEAGLAKVTIVSGAIKAGDLIADVLGPDALGEDSEWAYMISFLPGLKSAGGTEEILRNTIGERVLGLPPEPRLDKGIPFSELRSKEGSGGMNLALSETSRCSCARPRAARCRASRRSRPRARRSTATRARCPTCGRPPREAGWPGLLIDEAHGGAGLDAFDAMLVLGECGRVLAGDPLLGHLPATAILNDAPERRLLLEALATGERRAAYLPVSPPDDLESSWSADPASGLERGAPRRRPTRARTGACVSGSFAFVPDAPGADVLVGVALLDGQPVGVAIEADAAGVTVEAVTRYDATRSLGHVTLSDAPAVVLDAPPRSRSPAAWHLAQALIAAESLGSVETALDVSVAYAKERHTFGRAIGSYQAVKHSLTEVLRQLENGRSLLYYAGWARRRAGRVPARGQRRALGRRSRARPGRAHDDLRARRHRRHLGARRAAVLPPRPALPAPARRHRRRDRPGRRRADAAGRRRLRRPRPAPPA